MYHKLKYVIATDSNRAKVIALDAIHVRPERRSKRGTLIPARFDTALINVASGGKTGLEGALLASAAYHKLTCIKGTGWVKYG